MKYLGFLERVYCNLLKFIEKLLKANNFICLWIINRKQKWKKEISENMAVSQNSKILASDISEAIKSITRSGTTFTYTTVSGGTGTFTQQDNNTTYSAGTGLSLSSNKFSLATVVTAGNAGPTANKTLTYSGTFVVPYITYDAYGRVTGRTNRTMTMPEASSGKPTALYYVYSQSANNTLPSGGTWLCWLVDTYEGNSRLIMRAIAGRNNILFDRPVYRNPCSLVKQIFHTFSG